MVVRFSGKACVYVNFLFKADDVSGLKLLDSESPVLMNGRSLSVSLLIYFRLTNAGKAQDLHPDRRMHGDWGV
jgi:hypothetical protein